MSTFLEIFCEFEENILKFVRKRQVGMVRFDPSVPLGAFVSALSLVLSPSLIVIESQVEKPWKTT